MEQETLLQIFERRQIKYMLGKKVSRDICGEDDVVIIGNGGIITEEIIEKAKQANRFLELTMNIEVED